MKTLILIYVSMVKVIQTVCHVRHCMAYTVGAEIQDKLGFFGVFNTKLLKWRFVDIDKKIYTKFHGGKLVTVCHNQFLIISGGSTDDTIMQKISVFDLNSLQLNENNVQLIGTFQISKKYNSHGMIKIKCHSDFIKNEFEPKNESNNIENINTKDEYDKVIDISLLLFGGMHLKFEDSFCHVTIRIGVAIDDAENKKNTSTNYSCKQHNAIASSDN